MTVSFVTFLLADSDMPSGGHEYKGTGRSESEEIDSNATRSLFVGNIPKNISIYELRDVFHRYGPILVGWLLVLSLSRFYLVCFSSERMWRLRR